MTCIRFKPLSNTFAPTLKIFIIAPVTTLMKLQTWHLEYQFLVIRVVIVKKRRCESEEGGLSIEMSCSMRSR